MPAEAEALMQANAGAGRRQERGGGGVLFQVAWHRVVLDEAQSIKNPRTLVSHAAACLHVRPSHLQAEFRGLGNPKL